MKTIFSAMLIIATAGGVFSRWLKKEEPDLDQQVLNQLKKAGSNLSKPHNIEFFIYFPTETSANEAVKPIKDESCEIEVSPGADQTSWLCFATRLMVPNHDELVRLRKRFNEIAEQGNGKYDGWGTPVVK